MLILSEIRDTLAGVVSLIDQELQAPPAPAPSPAPAPAPVFATIPITYQLFGPTQTNGFLQQVPNNEFAFQGQALTASTKALYLGPNVADVNWARAVVVWAPGSAANEIEIVKFDGGPTNLQRIGLMAGQNVSTPLVSEVNLTQAFEGIVAEGRAGCLLKQIGFRVRGSTAYTIFEVRVEVSWKVRAA